MEDSDIKFSVDLLSTCVKIDFAIGMEIVQEVFSNIASMRRLSMIYLNRWGKTFEEIWIAEPNECRIEEVSAKCPECLMCHSL